jgi:rRNA maturation RNase YbeY
MDPEFVRDDAPQLLVQFFSEDTDFGIEDTEGLERWLGETAAHEGYTIDEVTYIFCSDEYLLAINQQYLQHDDFTDIITFPYHEGGSVISGDIYISVDRVKENASLYQVTFKEELHRVMVHGMLHLVGYVDVTKEDKEFMRGKENFYLARFSG